MLRYILDENEFLYPFGIRSISKIHETQPFIFRSHGEEYRVEYVPANRPRRCSAAIPTGAAQCGSRSIS
jgi:hypothetical protein